MSATIPDTSANSLEHAVLKRLQMKMFSYHPSSLPIPKHLAPEKTLDAPSEAELIAELAKITAV